MTLFDLQMNLSPPRQPRTSLLETEGGAASEGMAGGAVVSSDDPLRELLHILEAAEFAQTCCDQPEDRMWHAADNTWWRRVGNRWVMAEAPMGWVNND